DLYDYCVECDELHRIEDMVAVNTYGPYVCEACLDRYYYMCDHCGYPVHRSSAIYDDNIRLCEYCYEHYYTTCDSCEYIIHIDSAYYTDADEGPFCEYCYCEIERGRVIHNYSYTPSMLYFDGCHYPEDG